MPGRLRVVALSVLALASAMPSLAHARQVTVRWTAADASATGFRLYVRTGTAGYGTAAAYDGLPTPRSGVYQVQLAASDTDTVYVVGRSYNASGESGNSNELTFAPPTPICGDGVVATGEQCDDGNTVTEACAYGQASCTVCGATCQRVAGATSLCGDGRVDAAHGETCDDGNQGSGDGCSATCQDEGTPVCGNGVVETGEECDDGNTTPGDGCDAACRRETSQVTLPYYVDAGGNGMLDAQGHTWIGDAPFVNGGRTATMSVWISNTILDAIFGSQRYGPTTGTPLTYELPVNGFGSYAVRLDFAELDATVKKAGQRVFDVQIEDSFVLPDIDVYAAVGARTAYSRDFTVNVSDGSLTIRLIPKIGEPMIAGIEVSYPTIPAATPAAPDLCKGKSSKWCN